MRPLHEIHLTNDVQVYALRFVQGYETVDVIWSLSPTKILLQTTHESATVFNRDGDKWTVEASGGILEIYPSPSPIYLRQPL